MLNLAQEINFRVLVTLAENEEELSNETDQPNAPMLQLDFLDVRERTIIR